MKILQINDKYSLVGGSEKTLRVCSEQLARLGHEVLVVHGEDEAVDEPDTPWRQYSVPSLRTCTPLGEYTNCLRSLMELIHNERPDIIHVRNFSGFRCNEQLAKSVPVVRTVHTIWGYCPNGMKYLARTGGICEKKFGYHCLLGIGARGCGIYEDGRPIPAIEWGTRLMACCMAARTDALLSGIIVTSDYMRQEIARCGVSKDLIGIVAPPVEIRTRAETLEPPSEKRLLYVGRIIVLKGLDLLLDAVRLLPEGVHLDVVGDGPSCQLSKAYAEKLGVRDRVTFHGWVDYDHLGDLYSKSCAVAFPSIAAEAFGNVGPEAMVHGRPVVAFDVGGIREWLVDGENGFVVPPGDTVAFAQKLRILLDDPNRAFEMGMAGRERTKRLFSAEEHARKTVEFYEECIERWKSSHRGGIRT